MKIVIIPNEIRSAVYFSKKEMDVLVKYIENPSMPRNKTENRRLDGIKRGISKASTRKGK